MMQPSSSELSEARRDWATDSFFCTNQRAPCSPELEQLLEERAAQLQLHQLTGSCSTRPVFSCWANPHAQPPSPPRQYLPPDSPLPSPKEGLISKIRPTLFAAVDTYASCAIPTSGTVLDEALAPRHARCEEGGGVESVERGHRHSSLGVESRVCKREVRHITTTIGFSRARDSRAKVEGMGEMEGFGRGGWERMARPYSSGGEMCAVRARHQADQPGRMRPATSEGVRLCGEGEGRGRVGQKRLEASARPLTAELCRRAVPAEGGSLACRAPLARPGETGVSDSNLTPPAASYNGLQRQLRSGCSHSLPSLVDMVLKQPGIFDEKSFPSLHGRDRPLRRGASTPYLLEVGIKAICACGS
ncbi:MAG: hypothetical protein SGPRY_000541 [Prymnesium sp.]